MKITFINPVRELGGGERWLLGMAAALRAQGHAPTVLCRPDATWAGLAINGGIETTRLPMIHDLSIRSVLQLAKVLRRQSPDVVVCCNQRAVRLGVPAARLSGRPPVVYRNGLAGSFKNSRYNQWLANSGISRFVVNARALAAELTAYGWIPSNRVSVIYNGVDTALYLMQDGGDARQRWGVPDDAVVVLAAGRLVTDKGHVDLVHAAARLRNELPRLRVVILGEGPERERIAAEVAHAGLEGVVRLGGFETDMAEALAACDIFCHPSRREGLPNAILEAMAAKLPVVATHIDGTPEVVVEGTTGYMVPPQDPLALAERLDTLVRDSGLRSELGRRGWFRVQEGFSLSHCRREWESLFFSCLGEAAPAPADVVALPAPA